MIVMEPDGMASRMSLGLEVHLILQILGVAEAGRVALEAPVGMPRGKIGRSGTKKRPEDHRNQYLFQIALLLG
jgi:hypothetical protein